MKNMPCLDRRNLCPFKLNELDRNWHIDYDKSHRTCFLCLLSFFAISNCASAKQCKPQQDPRLPSTWNLCILCRFLFRFCRGIVVQDWQAREKPFRVLSECKFRSWTQASLSLSIWPLLRVCPGLSPHQFSTQVDSDSSISSTVQVLLRYRWKCTDMWCEIFFRHGGGRGGWESAFSWEKIILLVMTWNYSLIRPDQLLPSTRIAVVQLNTKFWLGMLQYFLPWGKGKKILQDREPKARVEFCLTAMLYCDTASTGEPSALWESMARWRKMLKQLLSSEVPGPPAWERKSMEKHQGKDLRVTRSSDSCSLSTWLQDALGKLHIHTYPSMYL